MKTRDECFTNIGIKSCKLKYYNGTLYEFANNILKHGRGEGSVCWICDIAPAILEDMKIKDIALLSKDVIVTQQQIFKYRKHPKIRKGSNIPLQDYEIIEEALRNPTNIYEDTIQKRLVYICTHSYNDKRLVKVVVEPNYKNHGTIVNLVKSWGIVNYENVRGIQYRQIQ